MSTVDKTSTYSICKGYASFWAQSWSESFSIFKITYKFTNIHRGCNSLFNRQWERTSAVHPHRFKFTARFIQICRAISYVRFIAETTQGVYKDRGISLLWLEEWTSRTLDKTKQLITLHEKKERQYSTSVKTLTCSVTCCRQHRYCSDSSRPDRTTPTDCYRILQAGPFLVRRRPIIELCGNLKNKRSIYQKSYNIDIYCCSTTENMIYLKP